MSKKTPSAYEREQQRIAAEYARLTERLEECRNNFNFISQPDAIDALIFEENAILCRMAALTKEAKEYGFRSEPFT